MSTHTHSHSEKEQRVLLPANVRPSSYHIHLTPDLVNFTFEGKETVDVVVNEATSTVSVHALDIKVHTASFTSESGHGSQANNITYDQTLETTTFHFPAALPTGKGKLEITFEGNLNNVMMGFYRSKYTVNGEEKWMATTQMEPAGARRAFPCWDEPALKAVFNISLSIPSQLQALSNMDPISEKVEGNVKTVHFAPSPVMSTYLVAFCVGEFDHSESHTKEGVRVRVYTPKGKVELGHFSLDVATRTLSYFTDYFGIPYPLPKLDMIAIADFAAGAMENWGLVTYRETALLIDEKNSALQSKKRVAYVVAHELAHQWFGNLVTMEWWKELWLNEGFATFVGQQAVDHLFPDWDMWTQFVTDYVNRAQSLDGLENSHPIEVEVQSTAQIEEIFDGISYSKGASVIRMISNQIGEANMRKGLNVYLNRFKYRNAVTEDLWNALGEASGFDVRSFMNNYTKVTGYPLISIEPSDNECQFRVSQQRFFSSGKTDDSNQTWWVSLQVKADNSAQVKKYDLKTKSETLTFDVKGSNWFKVNYGQYGFYRVKYSADLTKKLSQALKHDIKSFNSADRIGLENDAFALAKAGFSTTSAFLELASGYQNEEDYSVWADLLGNLGLIASVWSTEPQVTSKLEAFTRQLLTPISQKLGWEPKSTDSDLAKMLRPLILRAMAGCGDQATIQECHKRFYAQINDNVSIAPDFRGFIYESVVKFGGEKEYEDMLRIFKSADLHEERLRALRAAASTRQPQLQQKILEYVLSDNVRAQDIFYGFYPFAGYAQGREVAWKFMREHFNEIKTRVGGSAMILDHVIGDPLHDFASEQVAHEIEEFFKANPTPSAERTIKQTIESINAHAKWLKNHREDVITWLTNNVK